MLSTIEMSVLIIRYSENRILQMNHGSFNSQYDRVCVCVCYAYLPRGNEIHFFLGYYCQDLPNSYLFVFFASATNYLVLALNYDIEHIQTRLFFLDEPHLNEQRLIFEIRLSFVQQYAKSNTIFFLSSFGFFS